MCLTFLCFSWNLGGRQTRTRREQRASSHSSQKWKELRSEPMGAWFAVKYNGDQWRIYGSTLEKHRYIWLHQNFSFCVKFNWTWCSLSTGPICLTLQHCSTKPRIDAVISCTCVILDLAQDLQKIFNENFPTRESREFISSIGIATTISFFRNSHDSNRFHTAARPLRKHPDVKLVRGCGALVLWRQSPIPTAKCWSGCQLCTGQLCLGLYSVYACLYNFKIFQIYIYI